jgi:hypothetical protein
VLNRGASIHRRLAVAALIATALVTTGCGAVETPTEPAPTPASSPDRTHTPAADPDVVALVLRATSMETIDEAGAVVDSIDFTAPGAEVVAFVEEVAEVAPVLSVWEPHNCSRGANAANWGGFSVGYDFVDPSPTGLGVVIDTSDPTLPNGVRVQTPSGFAVGDLASDLETAQPGVFAEVFGEGELVYTSVHYDVGGGIPLSRYDEAYYDNNYWGASASATNGVIERLSSPRPYEDLC